jgi:predicted TIM-barrel fold metal-dependent hydrolase
MAVKELGPERVIFGTDGPELDSRVEIHKIRLLKLKPEDEAAVLGGNVAKLLPPGTL